jgi:hypothetical protein
MMRRIQAKAPAGARSLRQLATRLAILVVLASAILWLVHRSSESFDRNTEPAGFIRGLFHGALMPLSWPNLLLGQDVTIYAPRNTGRSYKLGYTAGVNVCGALFFGVFFWRVSRWRKRQNLNLSRA